MWRTAVLTYCSWAFYCSSIDDLLRDGSWQSVEQQGEEQHCDENDQGDDDVLLVAPPDQVEEAFEWIDKPREGCVWTAEDGDREEENKYI